METTKSKFAKAYNSLVELYKELEGYGIQAEVCFALAELEKIKDDFI